MISYSIKLCLLVLSIYGVMGSVRMPGEVGGGGAGVTGSRINHRLPRVVIIGAGASGIAAASKLIKSSLCHVTILEAQNRIGGRVHFAPSADGLGVDLGAHWVHGEENNVVFEMASALGILNYSGDYSSAPQMRLPDGSTIPRTDTVKAVVNELFQFNFTSKDGASNVEDPSLASYIINRMKELNGILPEEDLKRLTSYLLKSICILEGCGSLFDVSTIGLSDYWLCPGDQMVTFTKQGYNNILDVLMNRHEACTEPEIPVMEKLKLGKRVSKIDWSCGKNCDDINAPQEVIVTTEDGDKYEADVVLVTVSLGVLKEKADSMFIPALPKIKLDAIKSIGIDVVNKVYLFYNETWWKEKSGYGLLPTNSDMTAEYDESNWGDGIIGFFPQGSNPTALVAWLVGSAARAMENVSEEEVKKVCESVLKKYLGNDYVIPEAIGITRSSWFSNQDIRGSYSYQSLAADKIHEPRNILAEPLVNSRGRRVLLFGGEATNHRRFSTVHGAIETGWREADRIIEDIKSHKKDRIQVVIIGAGIAGISAAISLLNSGITSILVLEAQDKPGGRVQSMSHEGYFVELGAQWLHGCHNEIYKISVENNLLISKSSDEGKGLYYRENGQIIPDYLIEEVSEIVESILVECEKFAHDKKWGGNGDRQLSVGGYLEKQFRAYLDRVDRPKEEKEMMEDIYQWHLRWQEIDNSCNSLDDMPAESWGFYNISGGDKNINFKNGYSSLIRLLLKKIPKRLIKYDSAVSKIDWSREEGITIEMEHRSGGYKINADHVIVTPSIAYLKRNTKFFYPPLPRKYQECLDAKGMDLISKTFLVYDRVWWNVDGYQTLWSHNSENKDWTRYVTGFEATDTVPKTLICWVGSHGASQMEMIDDRQISMDLTNILRKFTGNSTIPLPTKIIRSLWSRNKYVLGAYSYARNVQLSSGEYVHDVLATPLGRKLKHGKLSSITFAGEGVHKTHFATVHGAYESGKEQAQKLVKLIQE